MEISATATARAAGLRYTGDHQNGIVRLGKPGKFRYRDADGQILRDTATLMRIKALAIPPAWTDVWICPHANGHLQATGRDARGRKQYRYHARWRQVRDAALALQTFEQVDSEAQAKKNIVQAIESVAKKLDNTPTICRKCYVHPAVLESYLDGSLWEGMRARARQQMQEDLPALAPEEAAVLASLQQRLQAAIKPGARAGSVPTV